VKVLLTVDPPIPVPPVFYGGIERIVDGIATGLAGRGHSVALLAHPDSTCPVERRFAWRPERSALDAARNALVLLRSAREFRADVVHSFSRLAYLLPLLAARIPSVMSYQRHTGGARLRWMGVLGGARFRFTGCSEYIAGMGRSAGGEWLAIPNFADTDFYRFVPGVSGDAPLVFLSRIERIKGVHVAIDIARRAGRRLVIAGNVPESAKEREYWAGEIEPRLRPGQVDYIGPVDDAQKNDLLGSAAALVVPIDWDEPFGIVFAEALACGTPVISRARGALPEIIEHGVHGFLVDSVEEGAAAVARLGAISREGCRLRAERLFSRHAVVGQYEALYARLLDGAGA